MAENVSVLSVAERSARFCPSEIPEIVELARSALEMEPAGRIMSPPDTSSPLEEESPAADIPPANVEVAVEEACMGLLRTLNPPANSEVLVVDVATTNPNAGEVEAVRVKV